MLRVYFKKLYERTMHQSYELALREIAQTLADGGECLDCGANTGHRYYRLAAEIGFQKDKYHGVEWNKECVLAARNNGLGVIHADLNQRLPFENEKFNCIYGLSVLEHLLNPCRFLKEAHRMLKTNGKLIILTPNISTYFTAILILAGKMPSSGPHPDSNSLLKSEEIYKVSSDELQSDVEGDTPVHRHLVVFSYSVLQRYLQSLGFRKVEGYGFGLYPFPNFMQPLLERMDPYHCHQMVFIAEK